MIKFAHVSDVHLKSKLCYATYDLSYAHKRRADLWLSLEQIYEKSKELDLLLLTGDLFEKDYFTLSDYKRFDSLFHMLSKTEIFIIFGNHDFIDGESYFHNHSFPPNVHIFKNSYLEYFTVERLKTRVYGVSWTDRIFSSDLSLDVNLDVDYINILMIHADVYGNNKDYLTYSIHQLESLNFNYIALGHIHKPEIFSMKIAYAGSLEPLDFGEQGPHGYIQGEIDRETHIKFIDSARAEFKTESIEIAEEDTLDSIRHKIRKVIYEMNPGKKHYFLRLIITGYRNRNLLIDLEELHYSLKTEVYYLELSDRTMAALDVSELYEKNQENLMGYFIKEVLTGTEDEEMRNKILETGIGALLEIDF